VCGGFVAVANFALGLEIAEGRLEKRKAVREGGLR